jgi:lysophospholipase L1-like esterase
MGPRLLAIGDPSELDLSRLMSYGAPIDFVVTVCDGNSLTEGNGSTGGNTYPAQTDALLDPRFLVANRGVGGSTTAQRVAGFEASVHRFFVPGRRNVVVFFETVNSLSVGGATVQETIDANRAYVEQAVSLGWEVILCTAPLADTAHETNIGLVNDGVRAGWASWGASALVELEEAAELNPPGVSDNPTYYADTTHLTNDGYAVVAALVYGGLG